MREILFRGKQLENINETKTTYASEKGTWRYGTYKYIHKFYDGVNAHMICDIYGKEIMCDKETVGQFTGLLDKNGNKIFEGDILKIKYIDELGYIIYNDENTLFEICFKNHSETLGLNYYSSELEIVNNIHDNGELYKEIKGE